MKHGYCTVCNVPVEDGMEHYTTCHAPAPLVDWREDYERRVYGRPQARYLPELPERNLDSPSPDPDRELRRVRDL